MGIELAETLVDRGDRREWDGVGNAAPFGGFAHDLKESGVRLQHTAGHFQMAVTDLNQLHDTLQKAADALAIAGGKLKESGQMLEQVGGG